MPMPALALARPPFSVRGVNLNFTRVRGAQGKGAQGRATALNGAERRKTSKYTNEFKEQKKQIKQARIQFQADMAAGARRAAEAALRHIDLTLGLLDAEERALAHALRQADKDVAHFAALVQEHESRAAGATRALDWTSRAIQPPAMRAIDNAVQDAAGRGQGGHGQHGPACRCDAAR